MIITDSQVHIWEAHRPDRPWPAEEIAKKVFVAAEGARPHREEPVSADEMLSVMNSAQVSRAIIVPPSPVGDNNLSALEAAAKYPDRYAVMGRFDPSAPDARNRLQGWLGQPQMLGIRMTFHKPKWASWLDDGSIDWFWADCEKLAIPIMLLIPGRMDVIDRLASRHPDLKLILDHMGRPSGKRDDDCFADLCVMLNLAKHPNVSVKASSAPCYSTEPYPYKNIEPYLRQIFDAFGPTRTMWGSDFSRLPCTYTECVNHFLHELSFLHDDDLSWVMSKAISEIVKWPEPKTS